MEAPLTFSVGGRRAGDPVGRGARETLDRTRARARAVGWGLVGGSRSSSRFAPHRSAASCCRSPDLVGALPRRFAAGSRACSSQVAAWEASADLFDFRPCRFALTLAWHSGPGLASPRGEEPPTSSSCRVRRQDLALSVPLGLVCVGFLPAGHLLGLYSNPHRHRRASSCAFAANLRRCAGARGPRRGRRRVRPW
jgi:hypothetical protein